MYRFLILNSGRIIEAPIDSDDIKEIQLVESVPDTRLQP
jgi:hypothetical protein